MKQLYVTNRDEWCDWLSENHGIEAGIWLVFYKKKTSEPTIAYEAAVSSRKSTPRGTRGNSRRDQTKVNGRRLTRNEQAK